MQNSTSSSLFRLMIEKISILLQKNKIQRALFIFILFFLFNSIQAQVKDSVFSSAGTYTWVCPSGVTSVQVQAWGAGGGGGGTSGAKNYAGGGGAGGSYVKNTAIAVVPGTSYTIKVGAGGSGGGSGSSNADTSKAGGLSSFYGGSITTLTAIGGARGIGANSTLGANGTGGAAAITGNLGFEGSFSYYGIAGSNGNSASSGGAGGAAAGSGGTGGTSPTNAAAGNPGVAPGGGGSGGFSGTSTTTTGRVGGKGGDGKIIISYSLISSTINTPSSTNLSGFIYNTANGGPSVEQSFTISASNLTADLGLKAPADYQISTTSGFGFTDSLTLAQSGGTVSITTIYVRLKAGLSAGSYNNESIVLSSAPASSKTVTCSGSVATPIIASPSVLSLNGFNYFVGSGPSTEQSFTISASNLVADLVATAGAHYEVSTTSGSGFASSVSIAPSSGSVSTTIYVRLKADLPYTTYYAVNISITSTGASSKTVACNGVVNNLAPTISAPSTLTLNGFKYGLGSGPSAEQSFTINANYLIDNLVITPSSTDYEVSTTSGTGFGTSVSIVPVSGIVANITIYVRLKAGLSTASYNNETITISSTNASSQNVTCNGTVVNPIISTPTPGILSGFNYTIDAGPSSQQSFTLSGQYLSNNIVVTAPTDYEVSTVSDGSGFGTSVSLSPVSGVVASTTVYVRLKAGLAVGEYNNENISISSDNATTQTLSCNGRVKNPTTTYIENFTTSSLAGTYGTSFTTNMGSWTAGGGGVGLSSTGINTQTMKFKSSVVGAPFATSPSLFGVSSISMTAKVVGTACNLTTSNSNGILSTLNVGTTNTSPASPISITPSGYYGTYTFTYNETTTGTTSAYLDDIVFNFDRPISQASSIVASAVKSNSMTISWTRPNAGNDNQGSIVFVGPADSSFISPVNSTSYTVNSAYSSGGLLGAYHCVYAGPLSTITVTGLTPGTNYKVYVLEYNGIKGQSSENYNTANPANYSVTTATPVVNLSTSTNSLATFTTSTFVASAEKSFTISGTNLLGNIILTAPSNYQISTLSGTGFTSSITLNMGSGNITDTIIYVRLKSGLTDGNYLDSITVASTGVVNQKIPLVGTVVTPTINAPVTATLSGTSFIYGLGSGPSASQSFVVNAFNLNGSVGIKAPLDYEVSASSDGTGYADSISINPINGIVSDVTVFVRLKANLIIASYNNENITLSSNGATSKYVVCSGSVIASNPSITSPSVTTLNGFSYNTSIGGPSARKSFTIGALFLTADLGVKAPTDYEVSLDSVSGFADSITIIQVNGTINNANIYVRLKAGLTLGSYNAEIITISSTDANVQTVTCNGAVVSPVLNAPSVATLTGFTYNVVPPASSGPSSSKTFTVSANNLVSNLLLTAPTDYEISTTSASGYSNEIYISPINGNVANTTIYVRLKAGLSYATYNNETINITSTDVVTQNVVCSGTVVATPIISVTGPTNYYFNYGTGTGPSAPQSITFSGQYLTDTLKVSMTTANYEISFSPNSGYVSNPTGTLTTGWLPVIPSGGVVTPTTIYVRLKAGLTASTSSYQTKKLTFSSPGVSVLDTLNGVVFAPVITKPSPDTLRGFGYADQGPSAQQSFAVAATISSPLGIKAPAHYEISLASDGTGFSDSLTLQPTMVIAKDSVSSTSVYVRLKGGLSAGTYNETVTVSSLAAISKLVNCYGAVTSPYINNPTPSTLNGVSLVYGYGSGPSATKNFTVSAINLLSDLVVKSSQSFEVSLDSMSGFADSILVAQVNGSATALIYVRLKSGLDIGSYNENVNISSLGATNKFVSCIGSVMPPNPSISSPSTSSLNGYVYEVGYGPSLQQSFSINGLLLTDNLIVKAPLDYEISLTSGSGFTDSISVSQNGGIASATIFVRLKSGLAFGNYENENISISSANAVSKYVTCNGKVLAPYINAPSTLSLNGFTYNSGIGGPSAQQSFSFDAGNILYGVLLKAPVNYQISLSSSGSGFADSLIILPINNTVATTTIYVRLKSGLSNGNYNGLLVISYPGIQSQSINFTGSVVSPAIFPSTGISIAGFNYGVGTGPSGAKSFTVSGQNLIDTLKISLTTANFEISLSPNDGYVGNTNGPLKIAPVSGTVPPTLIYARLKAGLTASTTSYLSKKVTISSTGANSVVDTLNGIVFTPSIAKPLPDTLSDLNYVSTSGPSVVKSFAVSAVLSTYLGIKAPAHYEIATSLNSNNYTDSITLLPVVGVAKDSVITTIIYARLKGGLPIGLYNNENIVLSSPAVTTKSVVCNGAVTSITSANLNLKLFLEGSYAGAGNMYPSLYNIGANNDATITDSITVNLWSYPQIGSMPNYSCIGLLHTNGLLTVHIPASKLDSIYFVSIKQRNTIETWTSTPVTIAVNTNYDFTTGIDKAYSNGYNLPMKNMGGGVYALYSGDVNQDGGIDFYDMQATENDAFNFAYGYNSTDCNGDAATDALDMQIIENNSLLQLFTASPM